MPGEPHDWKIGLELAPREIFPIPPEPDKGWCELVNQLYGGKNYTTALHSGYFVRPVLLPDGQVLPGRDVKKEFLDDHGDPEVRRIGGTVLGLEIGIKTDPASLTDRRVIRTPFVKLAEAYDLEQGVKLSKLPDQYVLVPLDPEHIQELILTRR